MCGGNHEAGEILLRHPECDERRAVARDEIPVAGAQCPRFRLGQTRISRVLQHIRRMLYRMECGRARGYVSEQLLIDTHSVLSLVHPGGASAPGIFRPYYTMPAGGCQCISGQKAGRRYFSVSGCPCVTASTLPRRNCFSPFPGGEGGTSKLFSPGASSPVPDSSPGQLVNFL